MTATVHLTAEQEAQRQASGCIVVDGEYSTDGGERALQRMQRMNMPQGSDKFGRGYHQVAGHPLAPPELWRKLTEPCATCGGWGHVNSPRVLPPSYLAHPCPNPDCDRGRQVVVLTADCPKCSGRAEWCGYGDGLPDDDWRCQQGVATLGRFTIPALLPVVGDGHIVPGADYIEAVDGGEVVLWRVFGGPGDDEGHTSTFLFDASDNQPQPGQFVARPEAVA